MNFQVTARVSGAALAGMVALLGTTAASAAVNSLQAATPATIVLSTSPATISYPDPAVTLTGTLETVGPDPQGLADQPVQLEYGYGPYLEPLGTVMTRADGTFSWTMAVPGPGTFEADFAGGDGYAQTGEQTWPQPAQQFPARIVVSPIAAVAPVTTTSVTGQVQMQLPGGTWVPSPDAEVQWSQSDPQTCRPVSDAPSSSPGYTDADGNFSLAIQANPGTDQCSIVTPPGNGEYEWSSTAAPVPVVVPLTADPTEFGNFYLQSPSPVTAIVVDTYAEYLTASDQVRAYTGPVELEYQAPGRSSWTAMATATPERGRADFTVRGFLPHGGIAAGNWRVVIVPQSAQFLGVSTSPGLPIQVTVPTRLSARITGTRELRGWLSYLPHSGSIGRATVKVEKLRHGRWRVVATIRTGSNGTYAGRGTYRAASGGSKLPGAQAGYGRFTASVSRVIRLV